MIITVTIEDLNQAGFYLDGLDFEHSLESVDVCLEEDENESLYLSTFTAYDPTGRLNDDNIAYILANESLTTVYGEDSGKNWMLEDLEKALLESALATINEIDF